MVILKNDRLKFLVGINTGYVTDGKPDGRYLEFYRIRSSQALHCAIIGNVTIPNGYGSNSRTPTLSGDPVWSEIANAIAEGGSLPGIQFATAWEGYSGSKGFRPKTASETIQRSRDIVRMFSNAEIVALMDKLDDAADIAVEAGFRHLQVHAAHGYLFNLLIDCRLNDRAPDVLERLHSWVAKHSRPGFETSIRISLRTGDDEFDMVGQDQLNGQIADLRFDFIDVSSGFYNINKQLIYPGRSDVLLRRRFETIALAERFPKQNFILSGRALSLPERDLPTNLHIGLARDLIANPNYLSEPSRGCFNTGKCHYFSRNADDLTCSQWKRSGVGSEITALGVLSNVNLGGTS